MQESSRDPEMFTRLDELVERVTTASRSQHEQLCAFRQALANHLVIPCDAFVIGEPVSLIAFDHRPWPAAGIRNGAGLARRGSGRSRLGSDH